MSKDQTPTVETLEAMSNQVIAQRLLAQGLPTQPLEMLVLFMQFMANEVVNRLAQGDSLKVCFELTDRFARYESLRQRAVNTSLRETKARQKAAAEIPAQEGDDSNTCTTTAAAKEPLAPPPSATPPSPLPAQRSGHLSRQQRRALLRSQTQVAVLTDGVANAS